MMVVTAVIHLVQTVQGHGHCCDFLKQFWKNEIVAEKRDRSTVGIMGGYVFIISRFHKIKLRVSKLR